MLSLSGDDVSLACSSSVGCLGSMFKRWLQVTLYSLFNRVQCTAPVNKIFLALVRYTVGGIPRPKGSFSHNTSGKSVNCRNWVSTVFIDILMLGTRWTQCQRLESTVQVPVFLKMLIQCILFEDGDSLGALTIFVWVVLETLLSKPPPQTFPSQKWERA